MRPTDAVLEEEFFLHLFSGVTDGRSFGRRSFFLHLFSGATDGRSFGRRIFFAFIWRCVRRTRFWKKNFFCIYLAVRPTDAVLEEVFFAFI